MIKFRNCVFQALSVPPGNHPAVGGEVSHPKAAAARSPVHDCKQNWVLHQRKSAWILCSISVREVSETWVRQKVLDQFIVFIRKASGENNAVGCVWCGRAVWAAERSWTFVDPWQSWRCRWIALVSNSINYFSYEGVLNLRVRNPPVVWMYPLLMCYVFLPSYVPLSDNEKTDFRARELKSVYMDAVGQYLKLIFHKNYANKYNLYGQVS